MSSNFKESWHFLDKSHVKAENEAEVSLHLTTFTFWEVNTVQPSVLTFAFKPSQTPLVSKQYSIILI